MENRSYLPYNRIMKYINSTLDNIQPTRQFSLSYIIIDSILLSVFLFLLVYKKKTVVTIWALFGGILYWIVDFGYFYLISHSREIYITTAATGTILASTIETMLVLFWMSMSYGILDFAFIWLWLSKDKDRKEFTWLIITFWCTTPLVSSIFDNSVPDMIYFTTTRSTGKYHGIMALIMLVGYLFLIIHNLFTKGEKADIGKIFLIGFMSQFLWEFFLLVFNIRSTIYADDFRRQILTLLQDSLIETNLGLPYMYFINRAVLKKISEKEKRKTETKDQIEQ